jgi:hypothetical protein
MFSKIPDGKVMFIILHARVFKSLPLISAGDPGPKTG